MKGAEVKVDIQCDYCKQVIIKTYKQLMNEREKSIIDKDCCKNCKGLKGKEGCLHKYGVECTLNLNEVKDKSKETIKNKYGEHVVNVFQVDVVKEKVKTTNLEKYGVENPAQNLEIKTKIKNTNLEKYGVEHYTQTTEYRERVEKTNLQRYGVTNVFQNEDIKKKIKSTWLKKYGVTHPMQNEELFNAKAATNIKKYGHISPAKNKQVIEKMKATNLRKYGTTCTFANREIRKKIKSSFLERYGYEYPGQIPEIIEKRNETMRANGSVPTSSQQLSVYEMLRSEGFNVDLNFTFSRSIFDIALFVDDVKIDLEYDAAYFHQDQKFDRKRDEFVKSNGWKILRVKSGHLLPTLDQLKESINKLINSDRNYTEIVLEDWTLNTKGVESRLV